MAKKPTAHWPTLSLVMSLNNAGWGDLGTTEVRGVRLTLRALAESLPSRSGQGLATVAQVADKSRYSTRWTSRCLVILEDAGIITWHRGGVAYGRPRPSAFRINKQALVDLINGARPVLAVMLARRRALTEARLAGLWFVKTKKQRNRRSDHVELAPTLPSLQGGDPPPSGVVEADEPPEEPLSPEELAEVNAWRAERAARRARLAPSRGR